ncbi:hypothetical protein ACLB2K_020087 [Fragaria x ananassa]
MGARTEITRQSKYSHWLIALAGNKADLVESRKVAAYAQENGLPFLRMTGKTADNANGIFYEIAKRLPRMQLVQNYAFIQEWF